jgi:hypothetical protein
LPDSERCRECGCEELGISQEFMISDCTYCGRLRKTAKDCEWCKLYCRKRMPNLCELRVATDQLQLEEYANILGVDRLWSCRWVLQLLVFRFFGWSSDLPRCYPLRVHLRVYGTWIWTLCTPPCAFGLFRRMSRKGTILN